MRIGIVASSALVATVFAIPSFAACDMESVTTAEQKWAQKSPARYTYVVNEISGLSATYKGVPIPRQVRVELLGTSVTGMWYAQDESPKYKAGQSVPKTVWKHVKASPTTIFGQVRDSAIWAARDNGHVIDCTFDSETGLLSKLHTDSTTLSDSYYVLEITNFRALP